MPAKKKFYVKLFKEKGKIVGHAVSSQPDFQEINAEPVKREKQGTSGLEKGLRELLTRFENSMIIYMDFMPAIFVMTPFLSRELIVESLRKFLEQHNKKKTTVADGEVFELDVSNLGDFLSITEALDPSIDVLKSLTRNIMIGLIAVFDQHLPELIKLIVTKNPKILEGSERQWKSQEIVSFDSFEEFRAHLVDVEIDSLTRESHEQQVEWIQKKLNLEPIRKNYPHWADLMEICQRRHLFAHTNGVISQQYLSNGEKYGYDCKDLNVGDVLGVNQKYYSQSVRRIFEFGVMLTHVVWRKLFPENTQVADEDMNELGFRLLKRGNYRLSTSLLKFALGLRGESNDRVRRMIVVNYASALRLSGDGDGAKKILDAQDWSAVDDDFRQCVAAVRGDVGEVVKLMKKLGSGGSESSKYRGWPVFFHIREDKKFVAAYEKMFGIPFRPSLKKRDSLSIAMQGVSQVEHGDDEKVEPNGR